MRHMDTTVVWVSPLPLKIDFGDGELLGACVGKRPCEFSVDGPSCDAPSLRFLLTSAPSDLWDCKTEMKQRQTPSRKTHQRLDAQQSRITFGFGGPRKTLVFAGLLRSADCRDCKTARRSVDHRHESCDRRVIIMERCLLHAVSCERRALVVQDERI